ERVIGFGLRLIERRRFGQQRRLHHGIGGQLGARQECLDLGWRELGHRIAPLALDDFDGLTHAARPEQIAGQLSLTPVYARRSVNWRKWLAIVDGERRASDLSTDM